MKIAKNKMLGLAFVAAMWPSFGVCSTAVTARVLSVGTYGNGNLAISLDRSIDEVGCSMAFIEIPANAPSFKVVFAAVTLAMATNAAIEVKTDTCYNGVPSFSGARPAYLVVNKA